ncbi:MAG: prepilin-type N-terminal cleavage/methylation domain-containing protein, partial [Candidatus Magasanikbacteria bacterium]
MQTFINLDEDKGFTLIELLIVIAIIAILAGIVFVALDPGQRFGEARDSERHSEVNSIAQAVKQHQIDNDGEYLSEIDGMNNGDVEMIGTCGGTSDLSCNDSPASTTECVDLTSIANEGYLPEVPEDPNNNDSDETGYFLQKNTSSVKVGACTAEETTSTI